MKIGLIGGILRDEIKQDLPGTLRRVAELGFDGYESGLPPTVEEATALRDQAKSCGLPLISAGGSLGNFTDVEQTIARAKAAGVSFLINFWSSADSSEAIARDAAQCNALGEAAHKAGIRFCYHNHDHEFLREIDGKPAWDRLLDAFDPDFVHLELDVAWVQAGGRDPVETIHQYKDRIALLHLKDYIDSDQRGSFCALGAGVVDIPGSVRAGTKIGVPWAFIEQDRPWKLSPWDSVVSSSLYLREWELLPGS